MFKTFEKNEYTDEEIEHECNNDLKYSNEILVANDIDLHKYLKKIIITKGMESYKQKDKIVKVANELYPNVNIYLHKIIKGKDKFNELKYDLLKIKLQKNSSKKILKNDNKTKSKHSISSNSSNNKSKKTYFDYFAKLFKFK